MRKHLLAAASAVTLALGAAAPAHAYMVMDITDTGSATVKSCSTLNAASIVACGAAGFIVVNPHNVIYSGTIGGYTVDVTGSTANVPGTATSAFVNLSYTQVVNNTSGGDLFFNATGFGYTMPVGPDMTLFGSQATSTNSVSSGGTVTSQLYADPTGLGLFSNLISCSYAVTTSSSCDAPTTTWNRGANPTFSLTDVVIFDLGLGQGVNGSSNVTASQIPEPVSTALVGLGLVGLGLFSRRRQLKA
jgi:hypothetical protein